MSDIARATFAFAPGGRRRVGAPTSESSSADWSSESWSGGAGTAARSDAALRTAEKGVEAATSFHPLSAAYLTEGGGDARQKGYEGQTRASGIGAHRSSISGSSLLCHSNGVRSGPAWARHASAIARLSSSVPTTAAVATT